MKALSAIALSAALFLSACASSSPAAAPSSAGSGSAAKSAVGSPSGAASPSPSPTGPVSYELLLVDGTYTTPDVCASYKSTIASFRKTADGRIKGASRYAKDPYDAASYRRGHSWMKDPLTDRLDTAIDEAATAALDELSGGRADEVDSIADFARDSLSGCGLAAQLDSARAAAGKAESLGSRIIAKANEKPWYPRGFFEITPDLAGNWVQGGSDPCGYGPRCWYWTLDVNARTGCPDGVYVEVNFLDAGTAVDWSNDSLPSLGAHQTGRLQFYTYELSADEAEIADASCY